MRGGKTGRRRILPGNLPAPSGAQPWPANRALRLRLAPNPILQASAPFYGADSYAKTPSDSNDPLSTVGESSNFSHSSIIVA